MREGLNSALAFGILVAGAFLLFGCSREGGVVGLEEDPNESSSSRMSSSVNSSSSFSSSSALSDSLLSSSSVVVSSSFSSSSSVPVSSSSQEESEWCKTTGNCGTFNDSRDSITFKWTKIGDQVWMAENLNFGNRVAGLANQADATASTSEKYCYQDDETNCTQFGGLYQWHSAMALPFLCNFTYACTIDSPHRGICPEGWHIPIQAEWETLIAWIDADHGGTSNEAGKSLKSTTGWYFNRNGTDDYSWSALPGGFRNSENFYGRKNYANWWTASEEIETFSWAWYLYYSGDDLYESNYNRYNYGLSVRCVKD